MQGMIFTQVLRADGARLKQVVPAAGEIMNTVTEQAAKMK